jgi:hypothetical protein
VDSDLVLESSHASAAAEINVSFHYKNEAAMPQDPKQWRVLKCVPLVVIGHELPQRLSDFHFAFDDDGDGPEAEIGSDGGYDTPR